MPPSQPPTPSTTEELKSYRPKKSINKKSIENKKNQQKEPNIAHQVPLKAHQSNNCKLKLRNAAKIENNSIISKARNIISNNHSNNNSRAMISKSRTNIARTIKTE